MTNFNIRRMLSTRMSAHDGVTRTYLADAIKAGNREVVGATDTLIIICRAGDEQSGSQAGMYHVIYKTTLKFTCKILLRALGYHLGNGIPGKGSGAVQ